MSHRPILFYVICLRFPTSKVQSGKKAQEPKSRLCLLTFKHTLSLSIQTVILAIFIDKIWGKIWQLRNCLLCYLTPLSHHDCWQWNAVGLRKTRNLNHTPNYTKDVNDRREDYNCREKKTIHQPKSKLMSSEAELNAQKNSRWIKLQEISSLRGKGTRKRLNKAGLNTREDIVTVANHNLSEKLIC